MASNIPKKLKQDAIVESILEIRFESSEVPELLLARLSDGTSWKNYKFSRQAVSEIPEPIRLQEKSLKYQAHFGFENQDGPEVVRIGPNVLICSNLNLYTGWESFKKLIDEAVQTLLTKIEGVRIERIGLRYVNVIESGRHLINNINELDLEIKVSDKDLSDKAALTFKIEPSDRHIVTTKVVAPVFIIDPKYQSSEAVIDIDVYTVSPSSIKNDPNSVKEWIEQAHDFEKESFFSLLPENVIEQLRED